MNGVDIFAGPGGWDEGVRPLGIVPLGIEWDEQACATRQAAGHRTLCGDVAALDPHEHVPFGGHVDLLIGSPPCPTFSNAGGGAGHELTDLILACATDLSRGVDSRVAAIKEAYRRLLPKAQRAAVVRANRRKSVPDYAKADARAQADAKMSLLVVEPLRWALALEPTYIALEQVPPVLPLWRAFGHMLEQLGYRCWAGVMNAADYGVPQTRERAFLMASKVGQPHPPEPTHARGGGLSLLGELAPWVSMAEALGWGEGLVGFPRLADTPSNKSSGSIEIGGVDYRERDFRSTDEPAFALTEKARSWTVRTGANTMKHSRDPDEVEPYERSCDEPAPTVDPKAGTAWSINTGRDWKPGGSREDAQTIGGDEPAPTVGGSTRSWTLNPGKTDTQPNRRTYAADEPAPTVAFGHDAANWAWHLPSTTVAGDPRVSARNHHEQGKQGFNATPSEEVAAGNYDGQTPIRLQVWEAAVLQSFPPDYPWQGSKTAQFGQIGNAVPPLLARRVIEALVG